MRRFLAAGTAPIGVVPDSRSATSQKTFSRGFFGRAGIRKFSDLARLCSLDASDRVAPGRHRPGAPTDPYVLALEHTVPRITDSLRACKLSGQYEREQVGNA